MTEEMEGLHDKYNVGGTSESNFVLLYEKDPAARVALRAYAMATNNSVLAQDLDILLNRIERRPEDYPPRGSEGMLNSGVTSRHLESSDVSVLIIRKEDD